MTAVPVSGPDITTDAIMSDALRDAVARLVAISQWVDAWPANAARDPEALNWVRVAKVANEAGEAVQALDEAGGGNPRKPYGTMGAVNKELLDTALAALAAYEHLNGHTGFSVAALFSHIEGVYSRAGRPPVALTDAVRAEQAAHDEEYANCEGWPGCQQPCCAITATP